MNPKTSFLSPYPKEIKGLLKPAILKRLQKEKCGQGFGKDYKPFLTVRDVPSRGRVHRRPALTHNRIVHLLSDLELAVAQWCGIMEGSDVCFAPVLDYREAVAHPHNIARKTYIEIAGQVQPAPAPRFSRTVSEVQFSPRKAGVDTQSVLADLGYGEDELRELNDLGVLS